MPTLPTLPSRKLSKLWPGGSSKNATTSTGDTTPSEEKDRESLTENYSVRDSPPMPQQRLRSLFQDKDKGGDSLAADIELRKRTNERLYSAAEAYWSSLSKLKGLPFEMSSASALEVAMTLDEAKAACETRYTPSSPLVVQAAVEGSKSLTNNKDKMLPVEALGIAMASCATTYSRSEQEYRQDSIQLQKNEVYASHLAHLSAVHLALAELQSQYASSLSSTLLNRLARSQAAIEALRAAEKHTEVAREKMEAAERRRDKAREKREKNKRDVEEEARMARATYEEALADLETRTDILRDTEQRGPGSGVAILKEYMDVHLTWVEAQHDVLSTARAALDQYPSAASSTTTQARVSRTIPPPPPSTSQLANRRVVEPPLPPRAGMRHRSSSAPKTHKTDMSMTSFNDASVNDTRFVGDGSSPVLPVRSREASAETSTNKAGTKARIPFLRSESFTGSTSSKEGAQGSESGKKGRISALGASFARSSSSLALHTSDASKSALAGTNVSIADQASGEKAGNWASNLLSRKKDSKPYQSMGDGHANEDSHRGLQGAEYHTRGLSHVKETSREGRGVSEDDTYAAHALQEHTPGADYAPDYLWQLTPAAGSSNVHTRGNHTENGKINRLYHDDNDILVRTTGREGSDPVSPSLLKPWEKFENQRDSLGIGQHLTGNTVSSEAGSNPFSHEGHELSPTGTGNGLATGTLQRTDRMGSIGDVSWDHAVPSEIDEDDPADGLLGSDAAGGTIRRNAKR